MSKFVVLAGMDVKRSDLNAEDAKLPFFNHPYMEDGKAIRMEANLFNNTFTSYTELTKHIEVRRK
jgi:hypothetical protein